MDRYDSGGSVYPGIYPRRSGHFWHGRVEPRLEGGGCDIGLRLISAADPLLASLAVRRGIDQSEDTGCLVVGQMVAYRRDRLLSLSHSGVMTDKLNSLEIGLNPIVSEKRILGIS